MEKMKDLCSIKATLVDSVKEQLSHGIECVDAHEMGEVVDMIKDIYEAENYCMQSKYYKSIVEAMGDGSYGYNPNDKMLMDRTGKMTLATTDPNLATIFMSRSLSGALLMKVLIHELGHCALVSYGLLDDIHKVVKPEYWILAEEWVCNFIADYGAKIFSIAYSVLGNDAWMFIPYELDKVIA